SGRSSEATQAERDSAVATGRSRLPARQSAGDPGAVAPRADSGDPRARLVRLVLSGALAQRRERRRHRPALDLPRAGPAPRRSRRDFRTVVPWHGPAGADPRRPLAAAAADRRG